jgi:translation initiation factor 3 subunit L
VGDYGSLPLYHMLGYFSLIGLLRVHVLLGDFTLALKVVENVELNQKVSGSSRWEFCVLGLSTHFVRS